MTGHKKIRLFLRTYRRLAEQGKCLTPGGAQCRRVFKEWCAIGCPAEGLDTFIVTRVSNLLGRDRVRLN